MDPGVEPEDVEPEDVEPEDPDPDDPDPEGVDGRWPTLLVTAWLVRVAASLPAGSWIALCVVHGVGGIGVGDRDVLVGS